SFDRLQNVNPGFDPHGVIAMTVTLPMRPGEADHNDAAFHRILIPRVQALPGVEAAGMISQLPLSGNGNDSHFTIDGRPVPRPSDRPDADDRTVTPGYFAAMRIPLLQGRDFTAADTSDTPGVAIVSRLFAEKYFPGQDAIGQRLTI